MIRINKKAQMNMIFEGNIRDVIGRERIDTDDDSLPVVKITDDPAEIISYLDCVSDKKRKRNILVLMKNPMQTSRDSVWDETSHVLVGPTFAALLLKDYDLARKLIKWENKPRLNGRIFQMDDQTYQWIAVTVNIYIQELFIACHGIPEDIVTELDSIIRRNDSYSVFIHLFPNKYLSPFAKNPEPDLFFTCDMDSEKPYFATILERMRKEYPVVFEGFLSDMLQINRSFNNLWNYLSASDWSAILRMICRYRPEEKEDIFRWFEEETKVVRSAKNNVFFYPGIPKKYINDVKMLYALLKSSPDHFTGFMRIVCFMAIDVNDDDLLGIVKRAIRDKSLGMDPDELTLCLWPQAKKDFAGPSFCRDLKNNISNEDYLDYMTNLMIFYRNAKKERVCLTEDSPIMKNYYSTVINTDLSMEFGPFGFESEEAREERRRCFREKMKRFLSCIDTIIYDDQMSFPPVGYRGTLISLGDEELIVQNFECGLLRRKDCDLYINDAIAYGNIGLIPVIMAFST